VEQSPEQFLFICIPTLVDQSTHFGICLKVNYVIQNTHKTLTNYDLAYQSVQRMELIALDLAIQTKDPHAALNMINKVNP